MLKKGYIMNYSRNCKKNKEIHVVVKVLLSKLHKCKEDKKPLSQTQAFDFFTQRFNDEGEQR